MTSRTTAAAAAMLLAAATVTGAALLDAQPTAPAVATTQPAPPPAPDPPMAPDPPVAPDLPASEEIAAAVDAAVDAAAMARQVEEAMRRVDVDGALARARVHLDQVWRGSPRLGVSIRDVTADEAAAAGLDGIEGAWVTRVVPASAAERAGLAAGDIVVRLDGLAVRGARHLSRIVLESPAGRVLPVEYVRNGQRGQVAVTPETPEGPVRTRRGRSQ